MTQEPMVVTAHGSEIFLEVGSDMMDIGLPCIPPCAQCLVDVRRVTTKLQEFGLRKPPENPPKPGLRSA